MTENILRMQESNPARIDIDQRVLTHCVAACMEWSQICVACADACLAEGMVEQLRSCITTNLTCADVRASTERVLSRHTGYAGQVTRAVVEACARACSACAEECEQHAEMHEHCRVCAEACRRCEEACNRFLAAL